MKPQASLSHDGEPPRSSTNSRPFLRESNEEVACLLLHHDYLSELIGGPLPSSLDLSQVRRVLDVSCGPGGWVLDMAHSYPDMHVQGVDKNAYFIEQARRMALDERLQNTSFMQQDVHQIGLRKQDGESLDLLHMRFIAGETSSLLLPSLILSLVDYTHSGSSIVWTECEFPITNSVPCEQFSMMVLRALKVAGRVLSPGNTLGITPLMGSLLRDAGCEVLQNFAYVIDVSTGTLIHSRFLHHAWVFSMQMRSLVLATGVATVKEFDDLLQGALQDMQARTFCGVLFLRMVVGARR